LIFHKPKVHASFVIEQGRIQDFEIRGAWSENIAYGKLGEILHEKSIFFSK
jgi:hypothetical protein